MHRFIIILYIKIKIYIYIRLILISLIIAIKFNEESKLTNSYYAKIGEI